MQSTLKMEEFLIKNISSCVLADMDSTQMVLQGNNQYILFFSESFKRFIFNLLKAEKNYFQIFYKLLKQIKYENS